MDCSEIFEDYLNNNINATTASLAINKLLPELMLNGLNKEHAKGVLYQTYFQRYEQYNTGKINPKDFVLFIRDFVLFTGRHVFPRLVTNVVERYGEEFSVFVAADGATDVIEVISEQFVQSKKFIEDVYQLGDDSPKTNVGSVGDDYIQKLTRFKNYRSFEQKIAVHGAVELPDNHTMMISLPTGGGKSLVTQVLAAVENKLTIVIVPTVSLAKDQYLQAKDCITEETARNSIYCYRSDSDNNDLVKAINNKTARLLFTSPEAILKSNVFNSALRNAATEHYLHNVIIDEAHIVPDWGVHFRPDFQIFSVVLKELRVLSEKTIRTYLLSATLSEDVVNVLFSLFDSDGNNVQYRCDSLRSEPRYVIVENHNYAARENAVIDMIKYLPKPLIVYVIEPAIAKNYVSKLKKNGFSNIYSYTGETTEKERDRLLDKWKANEFDIMIATSAFGMGVDKSNVRTIIHACVPENLSRFYQEVGRAGRDGLPSLSILSYYASKDDKRNDLSVAFGLVNKSILKKENILIRLDSILSDTNTIIDGDTIIADLNTVPNSFTDDEAEHAGMRNMCWNANMLLLLHRQGYIDIFEAKYDAQRKTYLFSFKVNDVDLLINKEQLIDKMADDRQQEYDMRVAGYHKMADLIHKPKAKCWGKHFASLYPYAQPVCSGCPAHAKKSVIQDDLIKIRRKALVEIEPNPPSMRLRRYIGVLNNLLIPVEDYEQLNYREIINKALKLNIPCVVLPDTNTITSSENCLCINYAEFIELVKNVPWLLRNGVLFVLNDDLIMSSKVFDMAMKDELVKYKKIWCCKPDTRIISQNKTIHEFLNCRICNLNSI